MNNFSYTRATTSQDALHLIATTPNAKFLGGGTNLLDLMRENIEHPDALIDVTRLPEAGITDTEEGGIEIGAEVKNTAVANHRATLLLPEIFADGLGPRMHLQLFVDPPDIGVDRGDANSERVGNFFVQVTFREEVEHRLLAR